MGVSIKKKQELEKRVKLTGDFFIDTECSYREIAEIFSNNPDKYFNVSHITIRSYIQKYKNNYPDKIKEIDRIIELNKGSTIDDEHVITRINMCYKLLNDGMTIDEISKLLNISYWIVYYDLHFRLSKLDKNKYSEVKKLIRLNNSLSRKVNKE